jgi:hypothetical protein
VGRRTLHLRFAAFYGGFLILFTGCILGGRLAEHVSEEALMVLGPVAWCCIIGGMVGMAGIQRANIVLPGVSQALTKLGDFNHVPELRETVAELRAVAATTYYTRHNRSISKEWADFIEAELAKRPPLPIPARPAPTDPATLPRAAGEVRGDP